MKRYLTALALLVLASCAPVQQGVQNAVRAIAAGDDGATLTIHDAGVTFDPVTGTALQTVLYIGGTDLQEAEEDCQALGNGIACFLDSVSAPTTVGVTGTDLSSNVSYYREGRTAPLFFYVRE